jgi:GAF domain-containing protein
VTALTSDDLTILRDENRRLRALVDFGRAVTAERDLRGQIRLLCAELRRTASCAAAAVILLDPEQGAIDSIETAGLSLAVDAQWQHSVREASAGTELSELVPHGLFRAASVPLRVGEDVLGIVLTYDHHPAPANHEDRTYLKAMADAAAMAILNARLYAESHRELRRRDALRKVVASISSELDLDTLLSRVVGSTVELLDADTGLISLIDRDGAARSTI